MSMRQDAEHHWRIVQMTIHRVRSKFKSYWSGVLRINRRKATLPTATVMIVWLRMGIAWGLAMKGLE